MLESPAAFTSEPQGSAALTYLGCVTAKKSLSLAHQNGNYQLTESDKNVGRGIEFQTAVGWGDLEGFTVLSIDLQMTSSQIIIEVRPLAEMVPPVNVSHRTGTGDACFLWA